MPVASKWAIMICRVSPGIVCGFIPSGAVTFCAPKKITTFFGAEGALPNLMTFRDQANATAVTPTPISNMAAMA
jgi:hypothetical protein